LCAPSVVLWQFHGTNENLYLMTSSSSKYYPVELVLIKEGTKTLIRGSLEIF